MSRQRLRYCFFGCEGSTTQLFAFPKDSETSKQWEAFVFADHRPQPNVIVCARHFSDDCFQNKGQYDAGFAKQLLLKHGAVPSIKSVQGSSEPPAQATSARVCTREHVKTVPTRTTRKTISIGTQVIHLSIRGQRSIATQLSYGTLKSHVRSKATQATVSSVSKTTETDSQAPSSMPLKKSGGGSGTRSAKRSRMEFLEEEEDEKETAGESLSEMHQTLGSAYQPGESLTDASQMSEMEPAVHHQPKYMVFERCLEQLFETCPLCRAKCVLLQHKMDTYVAFHQHCPSCQFSRKWQSQ